MDDKTLYYGEVIWFSSSRGIGFIAWEINGDKQKDMFVHFSDLQMEGFKTLYKSQKVSFNIGKNNNGDAKAVNVFVLRN